jgi:hypothetical protein
MVSILVRKASDLRRGPSRVVAARVPSDHWTATQNRAINAPSPRSASTESMIIWTLTRTIRRCGLAGCPPIGECEQPTRVQCPTIWRDRSCIDLGRRPIAVPGSATTWLASGGARSVSRRSLWQVPRRFLSRAPLAGPLARTSCWCHSRRTSVASSGCFYSTRTSPCGVANSTATIPDSPSIALGSIHWTETSSSG